MGNLHQSRLCWPSGHVLSKVCLRLLSANSEHSLIPNLRVDTALHHGGALGLFSGLNVVALVLVFFFVEETKRRSLEDLDLIFAVSKRKFVRFQVMVYLPWFVRRHLLRQHIPKPEFYHDMIWGAPDPKRVHSGGEDSFDSRKDSGPYRGPRGSFESADSRHA